MPVKIISRHVIWYKADIIALLILTFCIIRSMIHGVRMCYVAEKKSMGVQRLLSALFTTGSILTSTINVHVKCAKVSTHIYLQAATCMAYIMDSIKCLMIDCSMSICDKPCSSSSNTAF